MKKKLERKTWEEFYKTGLFLIINQILHIFGWVIVFSEDADYKIEVFPARTSYRGFSEYTTSASYKKVAEYLKENSKELYEEIQERNGK